MKGKIVRITGPLVVAEGMRGAKMFEMVRVGEQKLIGEIIELVEDRASIQVYEETVGIKPGEEVLGTGRPLSVELGPGILNRIFDGIQRPLEVIKLKSGNFIKRGVEAPALDRNKKWTFVSLVKKGDKIQEGDFLGKVQETEIVEHRILVPPGISGKIVEIAEKGDHTVEDTVAVISTTTGKKEVQMMHHWPVRRGRPFRRKLDPSIPLVTGQRIYDTFFPVAKGGTAAIPGPFGSGKCVTGDTKILANNQLKTIKDVFGSAVGEVVKISEYETVIRLLKPLLVYTFDGKKISPTYATQVYKGKTSRLIEIKTRSGRKIKLTPLHKLFSLSDNLKIVEKEAENLKVGDFITSPRKLELNSDYSNIDINFDCRIADSDALEKMRIIISEYISKNKITKKEFAKLLDVSYHNLLGYYSKKNLPHISFIRKLENLTKTEIEFQLIKAERQSKPITVPKYLTEELAALLGFLMSDGMVRGRGTIVFFNRNKKLRDRVSYLLKKLFNLDSKDSWERTVEAIKVNSKALVDLLVSLGYPKKKKSRNVKPPDILLTSPDSVIKAFLISYISGDGSLTDDEIEISTTSNDMKDGISYMLLRLGVLFRIRERIVKGRTYYRIFITAREVIKIHPFFNKEFYFNSTDIVPITSALFKKILGNTKPFVLEKEGISTAGYYVDQNLTVQTFQRIVKQVRLEHLLDFAQSLDYVFCDEIIEIKVIDVESDVYDITVPQTHNFVGGNTPMILHNTVSQHQLARWADADVIVYVGCGERGNEMTEVLEEFPELVDPKSGKPLMHRTSLIANTSNMPVAAREASVYTAITICEYFRDMGYDVALMADSTSRWAEAMREISGRLEEMPGEEGYPAYLASRLADFYERAGRVVTLGSNERIGSVTVVGAVSPPGGDFSEPVTQGTLRITRCFWALDSSLADRRHFPAINWLTSYSLYLDTVESWWKEAVKEDWRMLRGRAMEILQKESELKEIVMLVGPDALPERERITLEGARMIREDFLQQNAYHPVDTYCSAKKQISMLKTILMFYEKGVEAINKGVQISDIVKLPIMDEIARMKTIPENEAEAKIKEIHQKLSTQFDTLIEKTAAE